MFHGDTNGWRERVWR